jgi:uncharacterized membrane protein YeiH
LYLQWVNLIEIIGYAGIFVFALTGALKARTHQMDVLGGVVMAFATAYGGGTIRDILIGVGPVRWVNDYLALSLVLSAVLITFLAYKNNRLFRRFIFYSDAIGIGMFTTTGIEVSLQNGVNEAYSVVMGVITATFGGLIADILSNEVPNLLKRGELYATACLAGGLVYMGLKHTNTDPNLNLFLCVVTVVSLRIISKRKRLFLPEI